MKHRSLTRRAFLGRAAGLAGATLAPGLLSRDAWAAARPAPSERTTVAVIGTGSIGMTDLAAFVFTPTTHVLAVCDVDRAHRERARQFVSSAYAPNLKTGCDACNDFREILDRDDIDAVAVATPDHWHAVIAIEAMRRGKDVYCQKPMTLTLAEGRAVADAARLYGRVFQLGTQNRSDAVVQRIVELVRNGVLGTLREIEVGLPWGGFIPVQPQMPVPEGFDYDLWLGPAPEAPYTKWRCHESFRSISDYSGGSVTDLGTHYFDVAHWAAGLEETGPLTIEGTGVFLREGLSDVATRADFTCTYASGLVIHASTDFDLGCRFISDTGWIYLPLGFPGPATCPVRTTPDASDPALLREEPGAGAWGVRPRSNHHATFIDCTRTRRETAAPAETGHRSTSVAHLGNIAMRLGRKVRWNPDTESFIDDPGADAMRSRALRAPWRLV